MFDTFQHALDVANANAQKRSFEPETIAHLPSRDRYVIVSAAPAKHTSSQKPLLSDTEDDADGHGHGRKRRRIDAKPLSSSGVYEYGDLPDMEMYDEDLILEDIPKYCVERPSPLKCVNQDIVSQQSVSFADRQIDAIKPIYESRLFEERGQMNSNVLSYRRSMSVGFYSVKR